MRLLQYVICNGLIRVCPWWFSREILFDSSTCGIYYFLINRPRIL